MDLNGQARGLMQITPVVLTEYNNYHHHSNITSNDLFSSTTNKIVGSWYLNKRIPSLLRHYHKIVNVRNVLICYNAGT